MEHCYEVCYGVCYERAIKRAMHDMIELYYLWTIEKYSNYLIQH